jgi:hypothetical protein
VRRDKTHLKELVELLVRQIKLDEMLRESKHWFEGSGDKRKWEKLESELKRKKRGVSGEEVKEVFVPKLEEKNPFQSSRECKGSIEELVERYVEC